MVRSDSASKQTEPKRNVWRLKFLRGIAAAMVAVCIFTVGVGVGDGRIAFGTGHALDAVTNNLPDQLDYSTVNALYQKLKGDYDGKLTTAQLLDGLKHGLAQATGDPYTEYFTAKEASQFTDQLNNTFSGIGAQLGTDSKGNIEIIAPIKGYPAEKAGLKPKDLIVAIDGATTAGMSPDQAVSKIRGKAGTPVKLQVVRGGSQVLNFTITRADIKLPSVTTKTLDGNIGYVQISTFANDTTGLVQKAANSFAKAHVKGIILDLRDNPGGLLNDAVDVSSLWLPEGKTILQEKRGGVVVNTYTATGGDELSGIPTVVLINGGSASASEITAGALHDNGIATLIGEQSYGKGSVQQIENFTDGSELKVTIARWYRPNGQNIDKKGITPDKVVKLTDADAKAGNDVQLKAAETYLANH
ncbi:MAG TPA: S41 family peptidase [Candidatus Saccharimonadales bacterium]|nr:S41 family peptidase [Candidatus Saccharimonadales bacterium]